MATAQTTLEIVLQAKDEASSKINALSGVSGKLKGALLGVGGAIAGAFAVGKIVSFGQEAVQAFAKAEASSAKVGAMLATMGEKGLQARGAIEKLSQANIKLGFDDEDTAESVTKLFQATGDLTKAQELNQLAMDISAAKNIQLEDATQLVLKANAGSAKELGNLGVKLQEGATATQILGALQEKFAGQAGAASETAQGKFKQLGIVIDNLKETFGGALFDGIKPFIDQLSVWAQDPTIIEFVKALGTVITSVLIFTFKALKATIEFLPPFFENVITGAKGVATIFTGLLKSAITSLKDSFEAVIRPFQKVYDLLSGIVDKAIEAAKYVGGKVVSAVSNVFSGKASGGTVMGNNSYLVGERGPEIFTPMSTGTITPNGSLGGGSSIVININGGTYLSEDVAQLLGDKIIQQFKRSVRL